MSLDTTPYATGPKEATSATSQSHTVGDAIRFLESLKPRVDDILRVSVASSADQALKTRVTLNSMDVMRLEKGGAANVLWIGPKDGNSRDIADEETKKFRQVCDFIHHSFKTAGFLVDEDRPLMLHCTIINTAYRKRGRGGRRIPFAYADLLASPWFSRPENLIPPHEVTHLAANVGHHPPREPVGVDFGTWGIDEVQICEMGSYGPEGEYVCAGKIAL